MVVGQKTIAPSIYLAYLHATLRGKNCMFSMYLSWADPKFVWVGRGLFMGLYPLVNTQVCKNVEDFIVIYMEDGGEGQEPP